MITNKYERTYTSVENAELDTTYVNDVVDFLKTQVEPVRCSVIGLGVLGEKYNDPDMGRSYRGTMAQILRHLVAGGFVKVYKIDDKPIVIETDEYVQHKNTPPRVIKVHDDAGNEYTIVNPNYNWYKDGEFKRIKKTIIPKIRVYKWIDE